MTKGPCAPSPRATAGRTSGRTSCSGGRSRSPRPPNCGSDFETGWLPDAEYYSLDLPDDDEDNFDETAEVPPPASGVSYDDIVGLGAVVLSAVLFLWATSRYFPEIVTVVCAIGLGACFWLFLRWSSRGTYSKASDYS